MTYGGHARAIAILGLPLVGGHLAQFAIGLTDTVMLGWYGVEELAAVTLAGSYFFILFMLGGGLAMAIMPLVAASDAQGDDTSIRRVTRMGLWQTVMFGVLAMGMLWWSEPILLLLGQKPDVASLAAEYLRVAGWGIFPALWVMVLKSYLAGLERTQIVLWITVLAAVVNAIGNYALIFGNWGAPELGIIGAGIASVLTQLVSLVAVIIYALKVLPQHALFQRFWRPDWEMFGRVFKIGVPIGLTNLSEVSMFGASAMMMGWLGTVPLAAHGIAVQLASATFMVHLGLSNAATIRAGNAYGRQDRPHMAKGTVVVTVISLAVSAISMVVFLTCAEPLIGLFVESDEPDLAQILAIGTGLLGMAALFQLVDGVQAIALGVLRGVQDTAVPMVMAALSYWAVGIPASYVFGFMFGLEGIGVWLGLVLGLACAAVLLMARFWGRSIKQVGAASMA
ncbi:Multidrug resistance protein MdtK [Falsiruegeria litorea R37]|uniref:Multidrug-efflux transporter n=1 Tax=Falsiruegeria litorea R37 TaxID=1200284 RepID=A0A1Y5TCF6_9RHOB|nr:Multidrug resistance protein MdtK [Falsiruegeria litorea R37]